MKILAIIPAKLDSTRLKEKNIKCLSGDTPLFIHSVNYAKKSNHDVEILVSSESEKVENICKERNINFIKRSLDLCGDAEVVDVYLDVVNSIPDSYDLVVGLQPDNPNRKNSFDECVKYMLDNNYDDLVTVNENYKRSGSVRIFKYKYLVEKKVSKRVGCMLDSAIDIHNMSDFEKARKIFNIEVE